MHSFMELPRQARPWGVYPNGIWVEDVLRVFWSVLGVWLT